MYRNIIDKIKSCLPTSRDKYVIHEPFFDDKSFIDSKKCLESSFVSTQSVSVALYPKGKKQCREVFPAPNPSPSSSR